MNYILFNTLITCTIRASICKLNRLLYYLIIGHVCIRCPTPSIAFAADNLKLDAFVAHIKRFVTLRLFKTNKQEAQGPLVYALNLNNPQMTLNATRSSVPHMCY